MSGVGGKCERSPGPSGFCWVLEQEPGLHGLRELTSRSLVLCTEAELKHWGSFPQLSVFLSIKTRESAQDLRGCSGEDKEKRTNAPGDSTRRRRFAHSLVWLHPLNNTILAVIATRNYSLASHANIYHTSLFLPSMMTKVKRSLAV